MFFLSQLRKIQLNLLYPSIIPPEKVSFFDELHDKSLFYMISELSYNGRGWRDYCVNGRKGE